MRIAGKHVNVGLIVASLIIAVGLTLVVWGLNSADTSQAKTLPANIESIDPVRSAVGVPAQTRVFVDLAAGYTGVLIVDGVELPVVNIDSIGKPKAGEQVVLPPETIYEPGNATLTYTPTAGAPIEKFAEGQHTATVIYWKVTESRAQASTFTWTFQVF
ncbi:MAG TPA: hypothetical protein PKV27_01405 [Ilumatobacteraceae bacterium]|nr:hypothetical protein [Ilumatobacteraceae bacterium]